MSHPNVPDQNAQVTSAAEWRSRKEQGFIVTLPTSGNTCRVRRTMDLLHMVRTGRIPNPLSGMVQGMIKGEEGKSKVNMAELDSESFREMIKLVNSTVSRMMLEPRAQVPPDFESMGKEELYEWAERLEVEVPATPKLTEPTEDELHYLRDELIWSWQPASGHISVEDIDLEDRFFLFSVAQGGNADAESFRKQQAELMATISNGEGVSPTA